VPSGLEAKVKKKDGIRRKKLRRLGRVCNRKAREGSVTKLNPDGKVTGERDCSLGAIGEGKSSNGTGGAAQRTVRGGEWVHGKHQKREDNMQNIRPELIDKKRYDHLK